MGKATESGLVLLGLVLLVFALPESAQGGEKVLGAPIYDHATETTYRQVNWDDFKGTGTAPPGWNRWQRGSYAHIATDIRIGKFKVTSRQVGEEWLAEAASIRPYAIMNKDFSAFKHGSRNAYTLDHEQLHFDIAETFARRLAVRFVGVQGRGATREEAAESLQLAIRERVEAGKQELGELQQSYDGETANGQRKKQQKKWAARVPGMFRQASEALAALLADDAGADHPEP